MCAYVHAHIHSSRLTWEVRPDRGRDELKAFECKFLTPAAIKHWSRQAEGPCAEFQGN